MAKREIRNVPKTLTETDRLRHAKIRRQIESEKPEIIARGRRALQPHAHLTLCR